MKRFLTTLLALAMALMVLTGAAFAETDREPVTLTMFSMPANTSGTMTDAWWTDYLYDELGITIELLPSGDNDDMQLQAMMAADALPDIIVFEGDTYIKNAIDANMLLCLDDYADQMPNAQKYAKTAMQYYADNVAYDGKSYVISNSIGDMVKSSMLNWSTAIRWDLYQEIGAPEIKTVWDYLDVLKQMQDIYPVNEDGQKVYAITAWNDWDSYCMQNVMQVSMMNGIDSGDQLSSKLPFSCVDFETGELTCALDPDSAYVEGLKWYFTANQMGILDPDSMTQTWNTALEKANAGRILFSWWLWGASGYNTPERVNADEPTGFATVLPTESKLPLIITRPIGHGWCFAISAKSKNIDRCIEYLDFMCNPDKIFVLYNGPQGETWDLNEEGKPYLTEIGYAAINDPSYTLSAGGKLNDGLSVINSYPLTTGTYSELYGTVIDRTEWETYEQEISKLEQERIDATGYVQPVEMLLENGNYVGMPLANSFVAPLSDDMQILATQIGDIVKTQSWLAVYAADEAEFNQIVSDMYEMAKELGIDELMEYNKAAWDAAYELAAKYE